MYYNIISVNHTQMKRLIILLVISCVAFALVRDCNLIITNDRVVATNGYVQLEFDLVHPQIDVVKADFQGQGRYGANLMAHGLDHLYRYGILLEHDLLVDGKIITHASTSGTSLPQVHVLTNTSTKIELQILSVHVNDVISSDWLISISAGQRFFTLNVTVTVLTPSRHTVDARVAQYLSPTSSLGQFERGVQQMMNSSHHYFATSEKLHQYYALGETGSLTSIAQSTQTVLLSSTYNDTFFRSGVHYVLFGQFPSKENQWSDIETITPTLLAAGEKFTLNATILANNFDFPIVYPYYDIQVDMPIEHIRSMHTGVYASPASSLVSFDIIEGVIASNPSFPNRPYGQLYNFYDPDSWMSISAMSYLSDPYLFKEIKKLLETSLRSVLPSGQLPVIKLCIYANNNSTILLEMDQS
jgi:hypothetical protein